MEGRRAVTGAPVTGAARDLAASGMAVRDGARAALVDVTTGTAGRLRTARPPYPYRYAERIAGTARALKPREAKTANRITASVKVGGNRPIVSGGGTASRLVWGAEFGAKGGDVVRVSLSTGGRRTVAASRFRTYQARAAAQGSQVTGVRRGGLRQFPGRRADGWFLTPALDQLEAGTWSATDSAFDAALGGV